MSAANNSNKYDPNVIIKAAEDKVLTNDISGAQMIYQSALLDWVDDARETTGGGVPGVIDAEQMREAIATLWLAYAQLNINHKKYKSAMESYEQATNDPYASQVGRVWLAYARFAEERNKKRTAQNVYLRALVGDKENNSAAVSDEQDQTLLWNEFLQMMKKSNSSLTLQELKDAVQKEHVNKAAKTTTSTTTTKTETTDAEMMMETDDIYGDLGGGQEEQKPDNTASSSSMAVVKEEEEDDEHNSRPEKRQKIGDSPEEVTTNTNAEKDKTEEQESSTYVVIAEEVDEEKNSILNITQVMPPELSAAWFARDGAHHPSPPEPPLFNASPPKLADSTGEKLLGKDLALKIIQKLVGSSSSDNGKNTNSSNDTTTTDDNKQKSSEGTILLEVCRGLWLMTCLKEKETNKALTNLDESMKNEMDNLESTLHARLSVTTGTAYNALQQINNNERQTFIQNCNTRRQQLLSMIAWDFRLVLCVQQSILQKLNMPGFEYGPTVDETTIQLQSRICSFLHSAFFLRKRIGEKQHDLHLKKILEKLQKTTPAAATTTTTTTSTESPTKKATSGGSTSPVPPLPTGLPPPPQQMPPLPPSGSLTPPRTHSPHPPPQQSYTPPPPFSIPPPAAAVPPPVMFGGVPPAGYPPTAAAAGVPAGYPPQYYQQAPQQQYQGYPQQQQQPQMFMPQPQQPGVYGQQQQQYMMQQQQPPAGAPFGGQQTQQQYHR